MPYIDLSHTITDGMTTYKGLPAPHICDYLSRKDAEALYEPGTSFQIGRIDMVANTGTYMDCPFHRYADGRDLADVHLEEVVNLPGVLIDAENETVIDVHYFRDLDLNGKAVLILTGWSQYFNTERYYSAHPFLTKGAAEFLRDAGAALVGIDSHNIDDTSGNSRPAHSILLARDIYIVEHMTNLAALRGKNFILTSVPPKIAGMGTFPVRVFASCD